MNIVDIPKLNEKMGHDPLSGAHQKLLQILGKECLGWLLANLSTGIKSQHKTSFIKYYFTNDNAKVEIPVLEYTSGVFNIVDGRHRLCLYEYFETKFGLILINKDGYNYLINNDMIVNKNFNKNIKITFKYKNRNKNITLNNINKL